MLSRCPGPPLCPTSEMLSTEALGWQFQYCSLIPCGPRSPVPKASQTPSQARNTQFPECPAYSEHQNILAPSGPDTLGVLSGQGLALPSLRPWVSYQSPESGSGQGVLLVFDKNTSDSSLFTNPSLPQPWPSAHEHLSRSQPVLPPCHHPCRG